MRFLPIWTLTLALLGSGAIEVGAAGASHTEATLVLEASEVKPGSTVRAGIHLQMEKGWHTYWRNPGESGEATSVRWELPSGIEAGEIKWPIPEKYDLLGIISYAYHDEVVLLVPLKIGSDVRPGEYSLEAEVQWLECEKVCIPGSAKLSHTLKVGSSESPSNDRALIERFAQRLPRKDPNLSVTASWQGQAEAGTRAMILKAGRLDGLKVIDFYPYASEDYAVLPSTKRVGQDGEQTRLEKTVEKYQGDWPSEIRGVLIAASKEGGTEERIGAEVTLTLGKQGAVSGAETEEGPASGGAVDLGKIVKMLGFALLGGLILNIMPCVLPVISLKILQFVGQAQEEPRRIRQMGVVFTLGVLVSFLALAALVIGVQQAGKAAGWGMQFSNPYFLVFMTVLMTLVALNLFGLFEVTISGGAMQAASEAVSREGFGGAFFGGVLATVLATPCTAPFLSAALGFAFLQPPWIIILIFLVIGMGLALPYLVLSCKPDWTRFLPKPGPWLEKFKILMGFPMLATAVWLFWLLVGHYNRAGVLWIGLFLVIIALAAWIWGAFVQRTRSSRQRRVAIGVALVVLGTGYWYTMEAQLNWRTPQVAASESMPDGSDQARARNGLIDWKKWSPDAVREARKQGHIALVDFTADWCLTCQVNKETSLEIASTKEKLEEVGAVAFKADYTRLPPRITEELQKFGRAGVPLVVIYPADLSQEPIVLPEVLRPGLVHRKLEEAAQLSQTMSSAE